MRQGGCLADRPSSIVHRPSSSLLSDAQVCFTKGRLTVMVIRLPGTQAQRGPQPGPAPAWARFTRTEAADKSTSVSLQAYKPDITAYRVLGREPQAVPTRTDGIR